MTTTNNATSPIRHIAIDANEANVVNRVGSNNYAFALLQELYALTSKRKNLDITILLSSPKVADLPKPRANWRYMVIGPATLWTKWALPIHLLLHRHDYQVFFTFSHYGPHISSVPYVSSVMDLAYLHYPEQFKPTDLLKLRDWTERTVKFARKVITISHFSKQEIVKHYHRQPKDVVVAYPSFVFAKSAEYQQSREFFAKHKLQRNYFLYLGTLQPRKNIIGLLEAYEECARKLAGANLKRSRPQKIPQLVLAGKLGWLTTALEERIKRSPFAQQIVTTGFVDDSLKRVLYQQAAASLLLSFYEGFGIPPLESMQAGTIPIVSNNSSLKEVVGSAGVLVDEKNSHQISDAMIKVLSLSHKETLKYKAAMRRQVSKFSWEKSARILLETLEKI